jgi:hypothetical protein
MLVSSLNAAAGPTLRTAERPSGVLKVMRCFIRYHHANRAY